MIRKIFLCSFSALILLLFSSCNESHYYNYNFFDDDQELYHNCDGTITVAVKKGTPGCFVIGGERYGYWFDILNAYAATKDKDIAVQSWESKRALTDKLKQGQTKIGVSYSSDGYNNRGLTIPLYTTNYVLLTTINRAKKYMNNNRDLSSIGDDNTIMISSGFEETESYNKLFDSLTVAKLYITSQEGASVMRSLSGGKYDFVICEKSEALVAQRLMNNLKIVDEFAEEVTINLVLNNRNLHDSLSLWIAQNQEGKEFTDLKKRYFSSGLANQISLINKPNRVIGGISIWDDLIREVGEKEEVDWRLLSAIAYYESRFRPEMVSPRGARGMMQIMPIAARQVKMEGRNLHDPKVSLTIASLLIKDLERILSFSTEINEEDRVSIMLAAYNCGIGNIRSAQRLADFHQEDKNSWEVISKYLTLMGDSKFNPEGVKFNRFKGSNETLRFANNVYKRYTTYKSTVN